MSTCINFIWENPCSSHLEINRKTLLSAAMGPGPKWGTWLILEPKTCKATNRVPDTRVIDDIDLDPGSVTLFKYIPGLLTTPKSIPFQMKIWTSNFQVNWRRKSYVCTKGGSKFMKTIWVKWQACRMILVHLHLQSHSTGTVSTKWEEKNKNSVLIHKVEIVIVKNLE